MLARGYQGDVTALDISDRVRGLIRDVPDFPKPGILFKDLTPVFRCAETLRGLTTALSSRYADHGVDAVVAIESRGFVVGTPMALMMNKGIVLVRKRGKLPGTVVKRSYDLEYGQDILEMKHDAIEPGMRVVVVDDLLATGGTMRATIDLVRDQGAEVVEAAFVVELGFLEGRKRLADVSCHSLVLY